MQTNYSATVSRCAVWGMTTLALMVTGCGGGGTTAEVKLPEAERPDIDSAAASSGGLTVPGPADFNYTSFRSGQVGAGRGESKRSGPAGAMCRAECQKDGSAWGEFQFGYTFDNKTGKSLDAVVKVRLKVSESNDMNTPPADATTGAPTATSALSFFIKDSIGAELKNANLLATTIGSGPKSSGNQQELVFDARFEPDRGYYLIVSGRCDTSAGDAESLSASVEVSDVSIEISWKPAPSAMSKGDGDDNASLAGTADEETPSSPR